MIDAVVLKLSPEMVSALENHQNDPGIHDAYESSTVPDHNREEYLHVEPEMAADWVESWFSADELSAFIKTNGQMHHFANELRRNPLIRDFQDTILKIYRLTQSV